MNQAHPCRLQNHGVLQNELPESSNSLTLRDSAQVRVIHLGEKHRDNDGQHTRVFLAALPDTAGPLPHLPALDPCDRLGIRYGFGAYVLVVLR